MESSSSSMKNLILPVSVLPKEGNDSISKGSAITKRGAYAAIFYMICAVLLVMFNKAALYSYRFPCANVITLFQITFSTSILYVTSRWEMINFFTVGEPLSVSGKSSTLVPVKTLVHTLPIAISYLLYMLMSMESVRGINVPMYTTLRRTGVVFTMILEYLLTRQKYTPPVVASVGLIVFGAFTAGARDFSFDFYSYGAVLVSNITTATYLATISRIGKSSGLNSFGLMWCNGMICGPILLFWCLIRGDFETTFNFPYFYSPGFQTICGRLKDVFTVGIGWLLFGGLRFDLLNVVGQLLGFVGSGLYAYCKIKGL